MRCTDGLWLHTTAWFNFIHFSDKHGQEPGAPATRHPETSPTGRVGVSPRGERARETPRSPTLQTHPENPDPPRLEPAGVTTDRRLRQCDKRLTSLRPKPSEDSEGSSTHLPTCPHPGAACRLPRARASLQAHRGAGAVGAESKHCSEPQATGVEAPRSPSLCAVTRSTRLSGHVNPSPLDAAVLHSPASNLNRKGHLP